MVTLGQCFFNKVTIFDFCNLYLITR
uniref:Uncharacterized protein n=1 Tax=Arundo donax TaxID=35708 RepID=A0A0A9A9F3_ARUDO